MSYKNWLFCCSSVAEGLFLLSFCTKCVLFEHWVVCWRVVSRGTAELDFCATTWENLDMMNATTSRTPLPIGRPSKYTDELADTICHRMSEGENLNPILRSLAITRASFTRWVEADYKHVDGEGFRAKYTRARKQYIDYMLDHVIEIPFDNTEDVLEDADGKRHGNHAKVQRDRLKVDTIKWIACKVVPKMPSLQGTLGEIARNIVRGVEQDGLPPEQAQNMMKLLETVANIKKVDEFDDAIKVIPVLEAKLEEFERLRDEQVGVDV